jgi:hypothetical protein
MKIYNRLSLIIFAIVSLFSCAPTKYVQTLAKGESAIHGSYGGPLANVPGVGPIPIPFTSIGYGYGLRERTTVFGTLYPTAALFGNFQMDLGASFKLKKNDSIYGFSVIPQLNIMNHLGKDWRVFPEVNANFYHNYHRKTTLRKVKENYYYAGINTIFDLTRVKANNVTQTNHLLLSPQIGHCFERSRVSNRKEHVFSQPRVWVYSIEAKLLVPYMSNENIIVDYASLLGNHGGLGIYFGIIRKF